MPTVRTGFSAAEHGFRFGNSFGLPGLRAAYGLCGGMSYAALDYYHAGVAIPEQWEEPAVGSRIHRLLFRRQLDSLWPPGQTLRVFSWMRHEERRLALETAAEFSLLLNRLDAQEPAVLMLVRAESDESPTNNHQVVATGYALDASSGSAMVMLYDPSYPLREPHIALSMASPESGIALGHSEGDPLRGFFVAQYTPQKRGL